MSAIVGVEALLDVKRVLGYFKKASSTSAVSIQRTEQGYLLTDKLCLVRIPTSSDLTPFEFESGWQRATILGKEPPVEAGADLEAFWTQWGAEAPECVLELSHELLEVPGTVRTNKSGAFYRKFCRSGETTPVSYYDKRILDMFSPDLYVLEDFLFERHNGNNKWNKGMLRVSDRAGHVAYVMPCEIRQQMERFMARKDAS